jgi:outer membrane protein TolC
VQDAVLQQALVGYRETVIQAAREVEDAIVGLNGAHQQYEMLEQTVVAAKRATDVAQLRFNEGFADYQRVLDAQTALFTQQGRLVSAKSNKVFNLISLYVALGGGWQARQDHELLRPETIEALRERTDWGELIDAVETDSSAVSGSE